MILALFLEGFTSYDLLSRAETKDQVVRKPIPHRYHSHTGTCVKISAFIDRPPRMPSLCALSALTASLSLNCPVMTPQITGACRAPPPHPHPTPTSFNTCRRRAKAFIIPLSLPKTGLIRP